MGIVEKTIALSVGVGLGLIVAMNIPSCSIANRVTIDERYAIARENNQPYLVDNLRNTVVPIYEESGQIQCGDVDYRVKGLMNKGYDSISSLLGFVQ